MSIFENLNKQNNQNNQNQQADIKYLYQQFQQNPIDFLARSNLGIPQGMTDPMQILQFLNQSGRIPQHLQGKVNQILGR